MMFRLPRCSAFTAAAMMLLMVCGSGAALPARAAGIGLDAGRPTTLVAWFTELGILDEGRGRWLRLRMNADDSAWRDAGIYYREHNAMQRLRQGGWKLCWFVRWDRKTWANGVRPGQHLPLDLREAYERSRHLARAYGDAVDAWEIDNEPDLSFVPEQPETYTAFLKACYGALRGAQAPLLDESYWLLGERVGRAVGSGTNNQEPITDKLARGASDTPWFWRWLFRWKPEARTTNNSQPITNNDARTARVIMAPLAFPPGMYFERFVANDGLSYTDGFNFHYYGYPEDFTGVYRQFEDAVAGAAAVPRAVTGDSLLINGAAKRRTDRPPTREATADSSPAELRRRGRTDDGRRMAEGGDGRPNLFTGGSRGSRGRRAAESLRTLRSPVRISSESDSLEIVRSTRSRTLPVFVTEFGYASLGGEGRNTVEGREEQMQWFRAVTPQMARLGIEAPMAFYLPPYFEVGALEFGLLRAAAEPRAVIGDRLPVKGDAERTADRPPTREATADSSTAKLRRRGRTDDGRRMAEAEAPLHRENEKDYENEKESSRWRKRVGRSVRSAPAVNRDQLLVNGSARKVENRLEVTPALAWVLDGQASYRKTRGWRVPAAERSSVVLDFVGGAGLEASKPRLAHLVTGLDAGAGYRGEGQVILYNFGTRAVRGRLRAAGPLQLTEASEAIELAPGSRRVVPVTVRLPGDDSTVQEARVSWVDEAAGAAPAGMAMQFAVDPRNGPWAVQHDFVTARVAEEALARVVARPASPSEPSLRADAGWAVQPGTRVERTGDSVRFVVEARAPGALRRSVVETPWPAAWGFGGEQWLRLQYRLGDESATDAEALSVHVRMANGNLYEVWPRQIARKRWRTYLAAAESFTMSFYNPANLPWRREENRPVALVLTFYPNVRPAVFEVRGVQVGTFGKW